MKSTLLIGLFAAFLILGPATAASAAPDETGADQPRFRAGFFWEGLQINDKNLTNFYGHFQKNVPGFEASAHTLYNIDVWVSYRVYGEETKTTYEGLVDKFRLNMASFGILYRLFSTDRFEPFIGAGLESYSYSETIEGTTDIKGASGNAVGFHIQIGTYVNITKFLAGKVFLRLNDVIKTLDYPLPDDSTKLNLGGKEFGIGLVARF